MKAQLRTLLLSLFVALVIALPAQAQTAATTTTTTTAAAQPVIDSLSTLPEAENIIYLNAPRIVNEAMPRLMPEKQYQEISKGLDQAKAFTGIDVRNLEFIVLTMRFNKPSGGRLFPMPEVMLATRGDFDAKALIGMAMAMSDGKLREEQYGTHSMSILKLEDVAKGSTSNPFGAAFSEIAIAALDPHTLAVGNANYIKAALDAADGRGRIKPETLASVMRAPDALISIAGSPLTAFAKSFGLRIAESRDPNCMTRFGEFYAALNMDAQNFRLTGAMNADNPDTANIMKNMLSGIFEMAKSSVPDKNAQTLFNQMKMVAEGSEVMVEATIPQEMAAKYVREMFAPKPKASAPATVSEVKTAATAPKVEEKKTATPKAKSNKSRRKN
jgi:hypothetical protein